MEKIKLFDVSISKSEEKALKETYQSRFWASGAGTNKVLEFERKFRKFIGSDACVTTNSGTASLHLALFLSDIKGKEVVVPSLTFVSTVHAIVYNGGIPKFVDVDPKTLCMDIQQLSDVISNNTRAVVPVHFGGMPCDLSSIKKVCSKFNVTIVEDAAHATGATYHGKKIGRHSPFVCFSFHPVKNLAMPTGGAITLNGRSSKTKERLLKSARWCGITNRKGPIYDVDNIGWNYYMNEFSAAIGLEQLRKIDKLNAKRKKIANLYFEKLDYELKMPINNNCSYHLYWICVKDRVKFMKKMNREGIEVGVHYMPVHKMKLYRSKVNLSVTEKISQKIVSLPMHPNLTNEQVEKVIRVANCSN